jgi:hypothetical protein
MDEIGGPKWKAQTFDKHGIAYPRTAKGNPSFRGGNTGWMVTDPHWLPQLIAKATKYNTAASRFLEGHILDHIINGRVYSDIHPHRSDDGSGTCSLRFSYSDPPLQQMPRDKELPLVARRLTRMQVAKPDISQQEPDFYHACCATAARKEVADYRPIQTPTSMQCRHDRPRARIGEGRELCQDIRAGPAFAEMIGKPCAKRARSIINTIKSCRSYPASLTFASARLNGSVSPSSTTVHADIGIAGKRRGSTSRALAHAHAKRPSVAPGTLSTLGSAAGCAR